MEERFLMQYTSHTNSKQHGFTLVEVLFIAPAVLLTIAVFVGVLISLTGEVLVARSSNSLAYGTQNALSTIEQDVRQSGAFLATNSMTIAAPQGFNDDTTNCANAVTSPTPGARLVINAIATSGGADQLNRSPVWLRNSPNACGAANIDQNRAVTYNIVYFVKDDTLWRRTLMPTNYGTIGCNAPDQQPSCHPSQTGGICIARDMRLLDDVSNFTIQYFTSASTATPLNSASDPNATTVARQGELDTADTVKVDISAVRTVAGRDASYSGTIRATRVGSKIDY